MKTAWQETAKGPTLRIEVDGHHVSFYPFDLKEPDRVAAIAAISLWEGASGLLPCGKVARWQWRRGLRQLQHQILKEVVKYTTE